ncbi:MAG: hypothetical protein ACRDPA_35215 [Solirubrobacteraceae bacterium]
MTDNAASEVTAIGIRLIDDAYLAWFSAESECERALRAWFRQTDAEPGGAYSAYRIALDREEAAARRLEGMWQFAEVCHAGFVQDTESVVE